VQKLDGLAGLSWFQVQMERLGDGAEPDSSLGGWGALWIGLKHMFRKLPKRDGAGEGEGGQAAAGAGDEASVGKAG
jgi:hypothetical protein